MDRLWTHSMKHYHYLSAGTTRDWLAGVSYKGTFVKSYDAHWNMKECGIPKSWDLERN